MTTSSRLGGLARSMPRGNALRSLRRVGCQVGFLLAAIATGQARAAGAYGDACSDAWQIVFAAKPKGVHFWLSPPRPYQAQLPTVLSAGVDSVQLELRLRRVSTEYVAVEYSLASEPLGTQFALISVFLPINDRRGFNGQVTDQLGNSWSLGIRPLCTRTRALVLEA